LLCVLNHILQLQHLFWVGYGKTATALPLKKTVTSVFKRARGMLSIAAAPRTFGVAAADGGPDTAVCVQVSAKFFTFVG
jgi:hypothetical protein